MDASRESNTAERKSKSNSRADSGEHSGRGCERSVAAGAEKWSSLSDLIVGLLRWCLRCSKVNFFFFFCC